MNPFPIASTTSIAATLVLALAAPGLARADVCPAPGAPWLRVAFAGDGFTAPVRARVLEQLGADLKSHRLAFCEREAGDAASDHSSDVAQDVPLAEIGLALSATSVLSLEVRDAVTDKRTTRDLPLRSVPRDALPLSVALATEELLRASWIEAALAASGASSPLASATSSGPPGPGPDHEASDAAARAAVGKRAVPAAVASVNAEDVARLVSASASAPDSGHEDRSDRAGDGPIAEVALLGAASFATGGQTDLGGDLRVVYGGRLAMSARAGFRVAPDVTSAHGTVRGRELVAGLGVGYALVTRDARYGADLGARADVVDVQYSGTATPGAQGASGASLGAILSGAIGGWLRLGGPWRIVAEGTAGAPLQAVTASDAGVRATGVSGALFGIALGFGATIPN